MQRRLADDAARATLVARLLAGLLVAILAVELLLLALGPTVASQGPGILEDLRVLLAIAAALTVPLAIALGVLVRPAYALFGLLALPVVLAYAVTGLLLPWTPLSVWLGRRAIELTLSVPVVGEPLARLFFGGYSLTVATHRAAFAVHYALVALSTLLIALGIGPRVVRRRDGPDSRTA